MRNRRQRCSFPYRAMPQELISSRSKRRNSSARIVISNECEKPCSDGTCPPLPEMPAFDLPAVCGDGRRVPAHKLNAVSGVGRQVQFQAKRFLPGPDRAHKNEALVWRLSRQGGPFGRNDRKSNLASSQGERRNTRKIACPGAT